MTAKTLREASCADDYDPNSMPVDRARALIRDHLAPIRAVERVHIRRSLGRVLAEDIVSPIDVPGHDNSAMDGWAVRFDDLPAMVVYERALRRMLRREDVVDRVVNQQASLDGPAFMRAVLALLPAAESEKV